MFAIRSWVVYATTSTGKLLHDVTKSLIAVAPEVAWVTARVLAELLEQVQLRLHVPVERSWSCSYHLGLASAVSVAEALTLQLELFARSLWRKLVALVQSFSHCDCQSPRTGWKLQVAQHGQEVHERTRESSLASELVGLIFSHKVLQTKALHAKACWHFAKLVELLEQKPQLFAAFFLVA